MKLISDIYKKCSNCDENGYIGILLDNGTYLCSKCCNKIKDLVTGHR